MQTVLVANRGEIAVRIIRTCKKLGLRTVAVYSENDERSLPVRLADESVCIGPRPAEKSYLNIDTILAAAKAYRADLLHPGVGFLSENDAFAAACAEAGVVFIGPAPETMRMLGDKEAARRVMLANGFPVVPGSDGTVESLKEALSVARTIGYPLMIKAAKGGGGKGIRIVEDAAALERELPLVRREAQQAFGDGGVYLEAYMPESRHIEVQILADTHGNVLHLGTRECTLQRKNQKLIEEAPAANVPAETICAIEQTAVDIARAVGYQNAGTVEFLLSKDGRFFFMEMNARIQVEHPVTESIYGLDLVKAQIQVALGHHLRVPQESLVPRGHAIECRINAECPAEQFRPSPGVLSGVSLPGGYGVRIDSGYAVGDEISPYYDSMVLKLVAHADDREEAIRLCSAALTELVIDGIEHNADFARAMLADADFRAGIAHTKWIEQTFLPRYLRGRP
ncbi:MAG: acetyl-CoA carboxylase biotin carboxylase subunit [Clostridiales bacterium]|nr:acetyl-CoA carboxylase biotin carboxylase subunit [Clostridiales bacterium]